ncbi:BgTH12-05165 [Blumeria graminis f. sp. triticale]|uniref:BgTH12-05165 n=1 Tax=Blumeria graminis f. sp. triticale TaxID=1689686 RepID=A0A9W4DIV6_BLUGR|nr:BgTH12-05165 [Blumeria graminis f. sp. triticale]
MPGSRCRLLSPYLRGGITSHQRTEDLQELNERARAKALHSKRQQEEMSLQSGCRGLDRNKH